MVASAIALGSTIRMQGTSPTGPGVIAAPTPLGSRATLSEAGRMAYWRSGQTGQLELWVSDLDGGRRWTIATASAGSDIALTRWSPDGGALAYVISGATLGVSRLDGATAFLDIPGELRTSRWRIVSFEWSPDATRLAATLRAANGVSNISEVWLINAKAGSLFERITTLGDAFAGRWISPTQLFIEEASGATIVMDLPSKAMRPLSGMPVTSPQIGRDGRVYFVGGLSVVADVVTQPVGNGWVWSATIGGDDLRRETKASRDQIRLFGMLADGRAVVGVPGGVYVVGDAYVPVAFQAGTVRRMVVSDDGKRAVGITEQRILLIDPTKVPRTLDPGALPPANAATVLLSSVRDADVWFPIKPVTLAASARASADAPKAKLAFTLGRAAWQADADGQIRALLTEQVGFLGTPRWSPNGERLAVPVGLPGNANTSSVWVTGQRGASRWDVPTRFAQEIRWSEDSTRFAFWSAAAPRFDEWTTQPFDADTGRALEKTPGRMIFAGGAAFSLTDGDPDAQQPIRVGQRLELVSAQGRRTITDAARLGAAPLLRALADQGQPALINAFAPSADGEYVAVWLWRARNSGISSGALVVVRIADGEPVWHVPMAPQAPHSDVAWSPSGHLLAWTTFTGGGGSPPGAPPSRRATVVDPVASRDLFVIEGGRFAGWAPDARWIYYARDEGLFAYRIDGSGTALIGPIGVPVVATKP
jgi:hypothetical protein